jgi:flagellin-like protein
MKGVSEVIAIILILMIVIALSALAYTWFSGVFASLTGTASTSITSTTNQMNYQFSVETAKGASGVQNINLVIRNTGTQSIGQTSVSAYVNDAPCTVTGGSSIPVGQYNSPVFTVSCPVSVTCSSCSANICYVGGSVELVKVTIGTGLQQSATVTC